MKKMASISLVHALEMIKEGLIVRCDSLDVKKAEITDSRNFVQYQRMGSDLIPVWSRYIAWLAKDPLTDKGEGQWMFKRSVYGQAYSRIAYMDTDTTRFAGGLVYPVGFHQTRLNSIDGYSVGYTLVQKQVKHFVALLKTWKHLPSIQVLIDCFLGVRIQITNAELPLLREDLTRLEDEFMSICTNHEFTVFYTELMVILDYLQDCQGEYNSLVIAHDLNG